MAVGDHVFKHLSYLLGGIQKALCLEVRVWVRRLHHEIFRKAGGHRVVQPIYSGHYFLDGLLRVLFHEEVIAEVFGTDHEPEAGGSHKMIGVHFILGILLVPLDFFEVIDNPDVDLQVPLILFAGRRYLGLLVVFIVSGACLVTLGLSAELVGLGFSVFGGPSGFAQAVVVSK